MFQILHWQTDGKIKQLLNQLVPMQHRVTLCTCTCIIISEYDYCELITTDDSLHSGKLYNAC